MAFGIKTLLAKEAGLDDWYCIDLFYIVLYWFPKYLAQSRWWCNTGIVGFDPLSYVLNGKAASQWFVYGHCTLLLFWSWL
jgi:hypothetical protein